MEWIVKQSPQILAHEEKATHTSNQMLSTSFVHWFCTGSQTLIQKDHG